MKILLLLSLLFSQYALAQTISVDVGHSKSKPGSMSAYGVSEFSYNQALAGVLSNTLNSRGFKVNLIDTDGQMQDLSARSRAASNSDLLVSIHHDSIQESHLNEWQYNNQRLLYNDEVHGFGIFVSTKNPQFKKSFQCARSIGAQLVKTGFIPNYYHNQNIPGERKELLDKDIPIYQYDNLIVLKSSRVPALLIEAGVLTNRKESQWIQDSHVRDAFAQAVARGIKECL